MTIEAPSLKFDLRAALPPEDPIEPPLIIPTTLPSLELVDWEQTAIAVRDLNAGYGKKTALGGISLDFQRGKVTAIIGPSGSGKSTLIRCLNRMHEMTKGAFVNGAVVHNGIDICAQADPVNVRREIGMVFQKPNPFPKSIYENIAFGARIHGYRGNMDELVEDSLSRAGLWDEVIDKLKENALELSGGQQQRLCIARVLAIDPTVLLMDEPCSALDPAATYNIEELIRGFRGNTTVIIVTHNLQQAARVSDCMVFLNPRSGENLALGAEIVEYGLTRQIVTNPQNQKTDDYLTGKFG